MAVISSGTVEMHMHRVKDYGVALKGDYGSLVDRLEHAGYNPYLIFVHMNDIVTTTTKASAPHSSDTEVFPASNKLGLGGGTAAKVTLESDDNSDDGIVYLMGWGVDGNSKDNLICEEITLTGTTKVSSNRSYYDVYHMYALKAPAGNLTLKSLAGTTLLSITAGATNSNGSGFTIPLGWQCSPIFVNMKMEIGVLDATILYRGGWLGVKKIEEDSDGNENGSQELFWYQIRATSQDFSISNKILHRHKDSNNNELRIEHHMAYEIAAVTLNALCVYVLWKQEVSEIITD